MKGTNVMANVAKGKGKEIAVELLDPETGESYLDSPPGCENAEVAHYDIPGDPEPMVLEPGYWYRGKLGPAFEGKFGRARVLFDATYGRGRKQIGVGGCTFWVPSQAALRDNVLTFPVGTEVTMQCMGTRPFDNGTKSYTLWKIIRHTYPTTAVPTVTAEGKDGLPF